MVILVDVAIAAPILLVLRRELGDRLEIVEGDQMTALSLGLLDKIESVQELCFRGEISLELDISIDALLVEKHVVLSVRRRFYV